MTSLKTRELWIVSIYEQGGTGFSGPSVPTELFHKVRDHFGGEVRHSAIDLYCDDEATAKALWDWFFTQGIVPWPVQPYTYYLSIPTEEEYEALGEPTTVDFWVRCIAVSDEEEANIIEATREDIINTLTACLGKERANYWAEVIAEQDWDTDFDALEAELLPHIQHRELYDKAFSLWHDWTCDTDYTALKEDLEDDALPDVRIWTSTDLAEKKGTWQK